MATVQAQECAELNGQQDMLPGQRVQRWSKGGKFINRLSVQVQK